MSIYGNVRDLMVPFQRQEYYTRAMQGSYSIKYVLPALFPDDHQLFEFAFERIECYYL